MTASVETLSFPLLEVENLSKRFGDSAALTSISFSVREKEIVVALAQASTTRS
jgi:ABC-type sugar transport system ATPase subunit